MMRRRCTAKEKDLYPSIRRLCVDTKREEYSLAIIHRVGVLCVGVGRRKISRPEPHANRRSSGPQEKKYAIRNGYPNIRILDY
ncbi:unnamed protein product [Rhizophagus irregularis]|nr:unnamed protein product [Rhizophagus irregularis]